VVRLLLVERHGASDVRADLRVRDDAVVRPLSCGLGGQLLGEQAHEQDDRLRLLLEVAVVVAEARELLRDHVHSGAEREVRGADRLAARVVRQTHTLLPHRVAEERDRVAGDGFSALDSGARPRKSVMPGRIEATSAAISDPRMAVRRPKPDSSLASRNACDGGLARRVATARRVTGLVLLVAHHGLGPVDRTDADREQRERDAEADEEVVVADVDDLAALDREEHVGGDAQMLPASER
jgi:hypothetical protein